MPSEWAGEKIKKSIKTIAPSIERYFKLKVETIKLIQVKIINK